MQKIYYQPSASRIAAGILLLLFGLSPLIMLFYINIVIEKFPVAKIFEIIFNGSDLFAKGAYLMMLVLYFFPARAGFLFLKNSKNAVQLEFREDDMRLVCLPKIKSKGDIWAMGFGYRLDYQTIPYQDIKRIEIIGKRNARRLKIETDATSQLLNITVTAAQAEEIQQFLERKARLTHRKMARREMARREMARRARPDV